MSKKVPDPIAKDVKSVVYCEADQTDYLTRSRTENGAFLDRLVSMKTVGVRLSQYMLKAEVRTYIKDAILNRYAKDKSHEELPKDFSEVIRERIGVDTLFVEREKQICLYRSSIDNCYVVVASGAYLKWETALKKALLYVASKPFSSAKKQNIYIFLALFARHQKIPPSDLRLLESALNQCRAVAFVYGES